jgi:protein-tyrosine phosphatase
LKILFVCMGNICRSPTAEAVLRRLAEQEAPHLDVLIDSAGTHAYHTGEPPDRRAQAAAKLRGVDLSNIRARPVCDEDFSRFDLILAMDRHNYDLLLEQRPADASSEVRLFMEYADSVTISDVPDPYYGGANGFERVLDLIEDAARGLLASLKSPRMTA